MRLKFISNQPAMNKLAPRTRVNNVAKLDIKIYPIFLPINALILSSIGGWVMNNLDTPLIAFAPKGLAIKRWAVAFDAWRIGAEKEPSFCKAEARPSG